MKELSFSFRISLNKGAIEYDGGVSTGSVKIEGTDTWTILFEREPGETWSFADISFNTLGGPPHETVFSKQVEDGLLTVTDRLTDSGHYKYTLTVRDDKGTERVSDPEIENDPDIVSRKVMKEIGIR
jgi:hypothetical protein